MAGERGSRGGVGGAVELRGTGGSVRASDLREYGLADLGLEKHLQVVSFDNRRES